MADIVGTHKPISAGERIQEMDIVRGFALFGVLLVNITSFIPPVAAMSGSILSNPFSLSFPSNIVAFLIDVFAVGNFYTIFSFLFGLGFYVFMERAEGKGRLAGNIFYRRTLLLALFGLLHLILVWRGDVLHTYGLIGLLLLYFWKSEPKVIARWSIALLLLSTVFISGLIQLSNSPRVQSEEAIAAFRDRMETRREEAVAAYVFGSFGEVVSYRMQNEISMAFTNTIMVTPKILGLFLIGFYVGKRKLASNIATNLALFKRVWLLTGIAGSTTLIMYVSTKYGLLGQPLWQHSAATFFKEASTVFVSLFYTTTLVLLYQRKSVPKQAFTYLGYLGRMALTNYLVQCILCSLLLYGYGLGLKPSVSEMLLMALVIYTAQAFMNRAWLQKYKYGPFEYIWRKLTYGGAL